MSMPLNNPEDPRCAAEPPHAVDLLARALVLIGTLTKMPQQVSVGGPCIKFQTVMSVHQAEAEVFSQIDFLWKSLRAHIDAEMSGVNWDALSQPLD